MTQTFADGQSSNIFCQTDQNGPILCIGNALSILTDLRKIYYKYDRAVLPNNFLHMDVELQDLQGPS